MEQRMAISLKQPRPKTCKICKVKFDPVRPLQMVCSPNCAFEYSKQLRVKSDRAIKQVTKLKLKTKSEWFKEAQVIFNKFIRLRDKNEPCISCNRHHKGQYHAGHYRTVGAAPELRFNELNCHKQCSSCNNYLSGNLLEYRKNLIKKIGLELVEWLEGKHEPQHYSVNEIKELKQLYRQKIKLLDTENS